jgi:ElaB/YqjD/DUF883 family membrane-anchored ribosome-binding protein
MSDNTEQAEKAPKKPSKADEQAAEIAALKAQLEALQTAQAKPSEDSFVEARAKAEAAGFRVSDVAGIPGKAQPALRIDY